MSIQLVKKRGVTGGGSVFPPLPAKLRILKLNSVDSIIGNAALENSVLAYAVAKGFNVLEYYGMHKVWGSSQETDLAAFNSKARLTYGINWLAPINGRYSSDVSMAAFNAAQSSADKKFNMCNRENEFWFGERVTFKIKTPIVVGNTYTITLDGVPYSKTAVGGDTAATIASFIYGLMPAVTWAKSLPASDTIQIWANSVNVPFTYAVTANVSVSVINLTRAEWLDEMDQMKALCAPLGIYTSAYVQNYSGSPRWDVTHAARMIQSIDIYQGTDYTVSPDAPRLIESQLYLLANALQANPGVKSKQMYVELTSAESIYSGPYLAANGLNTFESTWDAQEAAYSLPLYANRAKMDHRGNCVFDLNNLQVYIP